MAKHTDAFTEAGSEETPRKRSRRGKKLIITDCGPDWSAFTDDEKVDLMASLAADDELAQTISSLKEHERVIDTKIENKHIDWFLSLFERLEIFLLPKLIERKAKASGSEFKIDADVATATLKFNDAQKAKLIPLGAQAANRHLPDKIKKMIASVGPGSEFLGELLLAMQAQQVAMVTAQLNKNAKQQQSRPNAGAGPVRAQTRPATRPQVPPNMRPFNPTAAQPGATAQAEVKAELTPIKPIGIKEQMA